MVEIFIRKLYPDRPGDDIHMKKETSSGTERDGASYFHVHERHSNVIRSERDSFPSFLRLSCSYFYARRKQEKSHCEKDNRKN